MAQTKGFLTVGELYAALEARMPRSLSCDWDRDGLSFCPDTEARVTGVTVALDPTEDAISLARETGSNVLLTHHPLIFHGLTAINGGDVVSRRVLSLAAAGISAMSFHTRLDAVAGGVNDTLAALLGLCEVTPFGEEAIGRIGTLAQAENLSEFASRVKSMLGAPAVLVGDAGKTVHRVALLGGAGGDDVAAALAAGADTYLSGALGYHDLTDAPESGMNLVAAGHYYTEAPVCDVLRAWIAEADNTITCDFYASANVAVI